MGVLQRGHPVAGPPVNREEAALLVASTAADQVAWLAGLRVKYGLRCHGQPTPNEHGWPEPIWREAYALLTVTPVVIVAADGRLVVEHLGQLRSGETDPDEV